MSENPICRLVGIEKPIFQGGMAWISDAKLAAAVSNAGGLGIISAMNADETYVAGQIDLVRTLTDKPFGVNVMLQSPHAEGVAHILAEKKVPVITTGAGNPAKFMPLWLEAGIRVIPVVASVAMAKMAARSGACAVVAEGQESGGHIGELTTMALVPQVCDAVDIPVIAAGGIADGRGMAAAFMLGAKGVQMGTAFLVANECGVHENYKQMVLQAGDISTVVTGRRFQASSCRCIKNAFTRDFLRIEYEPATTAEDVGNLGVGALRRAAVEGDTKTGCFLAGQISGLVRQAKSVSQIIDEVYGGCLSLLKGASQCL
ncbi:MAG: nitronate monooxygenase [Clostridiales bacterium]|nr:nitronate monooxygenase [Clostridiales bacterium]